MGAAPFSWNCPSHSNLTSETIYMLFLKYVDTSLNIFFNIWKGPFRPFPKLLRTTLLWAFLALKTNPQLLWSIYSRLLDPSTCYFPFYVNWKDVHSNILNWVLPLCVQRHHSIPLVSRARFEICMMSNIGCMHKEINLNIKKCNTMTI